MCRFSASMISKTFLWAVFENVLSRQKYVKEMYVDQDGYQTFSTSIEPTPRQQNKHMKSFVVSFALDGHKTKGETNCKN